MVLLVLPLFIWGPNVWSICPMSAVSTFEINMSDPASVSSEKGSYFHVIFP
jgi:hypothetical protein